MCHPSSCNLKAVLLARTWTIWSPCMPVHVAANPAHAHAQHPDAVMLISDAAIDDITVIATAATHSQVPHLPFAKDATHCMALATSCCIGSCVGHHNICTKVPGHPLGSIYWELLRHKSGLAGLFHGPVQAERGASAPLSMVSRCTACAAASCNSGLSKHKIACSMQR